LLTVNITVTKTWFKIDDDKNPKVLHPETNDDKTCSCEG